MVRNIYFVAKCLLFASLALTYQTVRTSAVESNAVIQDHRLPETLSPIHYKVRVLTNLGENDNGDGHNFTGAVWIQIYCNESTNKIILHSKGLTIPSSSIQLQEYKDDPTLESMKLQTGPPSYDDENEFIIIPTVNFLEKGKKYLISLDFNADLKESLVGYYRSSYFDKTLGKKKWISSTQFEPTAARRAFPCFDEPAFKAKFTIILGHHSKYNALSNMPVKEVTSMDNQPEWKWTSFEESVPMSTYLVAYSINDFEYREAIVQMKDQIVNFKVWARKDAIDQVDYALTVGPTVLKFYEQFFDVKFPLPKMDMIAIPDFSAGAMENWGLITYRETALLYHPNISSSSSQHRVVQVVAHELAHQWFGNLVTMKWWTDLWLNEGFATYVATLGVAHAQPEWNSLSEEYVDQMSSIFDFDSLKTSHAVSIEIGNPSDISQIFDTISYEKGSGIIRMMHAFLGKETFQYGVSNYLKKHEFGNAEQDDLWQSLTEEAHRRGTLDKSITVKEIMDRWTLQTGFPLVTINFDREKNSVNVTQKRYLLERIKGAISTDDETCWPIPLSYTDSNELNFTNTMPKTWLKCDDYTGIATEITSDAINDENWMIANIGLSSIYKVNYDAQNWKLLTQVLNNTSTYTLIEAANRAQLIDDSLDLAFIGELDYSIALRLISYLKYNEDEYIPWRQALSNLNDINRLMKWTPNLGLFKQFIKKLISPIYEKLNPLGLIKGDGTKNFITIKHKVLLASWACRFNVGDCLEKSINLFKKWMSTENPDENNEIISDLRSTIYCTAIRHGDDTEWEFLWQRYKNSNVAAEKIIILASLGCSREVWVLQRYLSWILQPESGIRKQDLTQVFASVARNENGYHLAKSFFFANIEQLYEYFRPDTQRLGRLIAPLAGSTITPHGLMELKNFVQSNSKLFEKASKAVDNGLERIQINIEWHKKRYSIISEDLMKLVSEDDDMRTK